MGRVKSNLPSLVLSKRPRFRPRKIVFPTGRNSFFKLKGSYVETSLNTWKRSYLLEKEVKGFYGFKKARKTQHHIKNLSLGSKSRFAQVESMLYVLLVRVGWADDITTAKKAIKEGEIKVNGVTTRSPLKNLCPGAVVEARESLPTQGLPDTSFLPHLISLSSRKFILMKNPEFHPEKSFLDLKRGLNQI